MTDFDDRFADRVREAFDAYEEPVDEAAWARTKAALASGASETGPAAVPVASGAAPRRAGDRSAAAQRPRRAVWIGAAALAALILAAGVWTARPGLAPEAEAPAVAVAQQEPEPAADDLAPEASDSTEPAFADPAPASGESAAAVAPEASRAARGLAPRRSAAPVAPGPVSPRTPALAPEQAAGMDASEVAVALPLVREGADVSQEASGARLSPEDEDFSVVSLPSIVVAVPKPEVKVDRLDGPLPMRRVSEGLSVTVASTSALSGGQFAEGLGGSVGVVQEFAVARGLSVSGGALAAYNRFTVEPSGNAAPLAFRDIAADPSLSVSVPSRTEFSTLALEIPLDVGLDVFRAAGGRVGVSAGVTSAVYLAQTFREEGRTYSAGVSSPSGDVATFEAQAYTASDSPGPLSRIDLARQLNLGLRFTSDRSPLAVEGYTRLPLGGLTSQDLDLTTVGVRLRIALR
ncbi:hypothetical protein [Rubricoccus marinus]|uniref:Outer membrane protein beta-barrel domain-containing protein n=1 Tax=Rubricoccus marinus TaxID=716817 RepID=A0A259U394_9BACT|nr:hypothetical protein [Rubricoccus marinus]OZC04466.1 hypothetical protein BSZ36_16665 [Rubricoccus marinus]